MAKELVFSVSNLPDLTNPKVPHEFTVLITVKSSRLHQLPMVFENLQNLYGSNTQIVVVSDTEVDENKRFQHHSFSTQFMTDSNFRIPNQIARFPEKRQGWIRQQVIKLSYAYSSSCPTLIVDSDTFFLVPLPFLSKEKMVLYVRDDVHWPYQHSLSQFSRMPYIKTSFVTHFQMMFPDYVQAIFGDDLAKGLGRWLESSIDPHSISPLSEYQTYGSYMVHQHPTAVELVRYRYTDFDLRSNRFDSLSDLDIFRNKYDCVTLAHEP
jgi:hypothetical protein